MRPHTDAFKTQINKMGRQIRGKILYSVNYNFATETDDLIIMENGKQLISNRINEDEVFEISGDQISSMSIIKNGNILRTLMKEFDFESTVQLGEGTQVNPHLGLKNPYASGPRIIDGYEYIDYGKFIIKEAKYDMAKEKWNYVCYDKMMFFMEPIANTRNLLYYDEKILWLIQSIVSYFGMNLSYQIFYNNGVGVSWDPLNYNARIKTDIDFLKNKNLTYRDILDKIAEICGGNFIIDDDGDLMLIKLTPFVFENDEKEKQYKDSFDEKFLKDVNINFDKKIGPINQVSIIDSENNYEYLTSISYPEGQETQPAFKIQIKDNEFALYSDTPEVAENLLKEISQLEYYVNSFGTTGICYLDFLDRFKIEFKEIEYPCLLLNNEITITTGIEEEIFTDESNLTQEGQQIYSTQNITSKDTNININNLWNIVNEQQRQIEKLKEMINNG